mmetsp:Transcript_22127/g.52376  ORF Transcript_22127/g.52376 Transcript_22127/m.52376 type:complete len:200 (-) Transcript_22127:206-805(-)
MALPRFEMALVSKSFSFFCNASTDVCPSVLQTRLANRTNAANLKGVWRTDWIVYARFGSLLFPFVEVPACADDSSSKQKAAAIEAASRVSSSPVRFRASEIAVAKRGWQGIFEIFRPRSVSKKRWLSPVRSRAPISTKNRSARWRDAWSGGSTKGMSWRISDTVLVPQSARSNRIGARSVLTISGGDCSEKSCSKSVSV